jgi:hypothetical protein
VHMNRAKLPPVGKSTRVVENWLRTRVGPAYDALGADPSRAVPVGGVRKRLAAEHKAVATNQGKR